MHTLAASFYQFLHSPPQAFGAYGLGGLALIWTAAYCYTNFIRPLLHPRN